MLSFFKSESDTKSGTVVPIVFPLIAGNDTLTTIISLRVNYSEWVLLTGILINLLFVFIPFKSLGLISRLLGPAGMLAVRKFFGMVLLAIVVKIFASSARGLIQ